METYPTHTSEKKKEKESERKRERQKEREREAIGMKKIAKTYHLPVLLGLKRALIS